MTPTKRTLVLCLVALALSSLAGVAWSGTRGEGENGAGFNYRGTFYRLSSAEINPAAVGRELDPEVPFQDTTVKVRRVRGVSPHVAVAAYTRTFPGTGSKLDFGWLLLSPDAGVAADPWAHPEVADVVLPPSPR
jgi:hypothetical protein